MENKVSSKNIVEALIFVSGESISFSKIQQKLNIGKDELKQIIDELIGDYKDRGVNILEFENKVEMITAPDVAGSINEFVKLELQEDLSQAAIETLSIIAYRGPACAMSAYAEGRPVSRAQIEDIRGVNCTFILRNLLIRGLVKRDNNPQDARSYIYSITADFLKKLGVKSVEELPGYLEYNQTNIK